LARHSLIEILSFRDTDKKPNGTSPGSMMISRMKR
jgi:hypothetical protein